MKSYHPHSPGRPPVPLVLLCLFLCAAARGAPAAVTTLNVHPGQTRQEFQGMGCGAIFYEAHITSLGERNPQLQERLYDDMFSKVRTDILELMIRWDHEPRIDNDDPYKLEFKDEWFDYTKHTLAICEAAKKRQPAMKLYAVVYSPPAWMKTNGDISAGGDNNATLKPGMELKFGKFCWAFLEWMHRHGQTIDYLSICNEPDWPHTQPGYCLEPITHAVLFKKVSGYLDEMKIRHPEVPRVRLVAPNLLGAPECLDWLPPLFRRTGRSVDVVGCHDYDRRGDRWPPIVKAAGTRPVWLTEWCVNGADGSPDLINSATQYWLNMTEAFRGGVNVWMAYDWVYPPRQGGEALIHLNWGKDYHLTKIYHAYRQWCAPLVPGMKVVTVDLHGPAATGMGRAGVKSAAFLSADGKKLVVHAVAIQDKPVTIDLIVDGPLASQPARRTRTSPNEDMAELPPLDFQNGRLDDTLPARGMATYIIGN